MASTITTKGTENRAQRLFVAALLSEQQQQVLIQSQKTLRQHSKKLSLTKPENLHLTLYFLGDVEQDRVGCVCDALNEIKGEGYQNLYGKISHYGYFSRNRGQLVYGGLQVSSGVDRLVETMAKTLSAFNAQPQGRKWLPHVTLARRVTLKDNVKTLPEMPLTTSFEDFSNICLFLSEFTPQGMRYTPLFQFFDE